MQRGELGAYSYAYFKVYCILNKKFYKNSWTETWRPLILFLEDCMFLLNIWTIKYVRDWL